MSRRLVLLHRALLAGGFLFGLASGALTAQAEPKDKAVGSKAMKAGGGELRAELRRLWEDHALWTRLYIVTAAANHPAKDATAARLLKNQEDLGNAIKPFYGDAAGSKLTELLKTHIMIATEIVDAAMKAEAAKKDDAVKRWGANADEIATFLSGANPHWPLADLKAMLHEHLTLTTEEAVAELGKQWDASIAAYDKVKAQMLKMADALASGIARQHPQKVH